MALKQLPVNSDGGNYEFKTELDGVKYTLSFRFNTRLSQWIMDMATSDGTILLAGIPLLLGIDLLARFQSADIPQGNLFLINLESEYSECGRNDLGTNCLLMYQEAA